MLKGCIRKYLYFVFICTLQWMKMTWTVSMHSFENIMCMKTNNLFGRGMLKLQEEKGLGYGSVVIP